MPNKYTDPLRGIELEFGDDWTQDEIDSYVTQNVLGNERAIRSSALNQEMADQVRRGPEYGLGLKTMNTIGGLADGILGSYMSGAEGAVRMAGLPVRLATFGFMNKVLGVDPFDFLGDKMRDLQVEMSDISTVVPHDELGSVERFFTRDFATALGSGVAFISGGWALRGLSGLNAYASVATLGAFAGYSEGWNRSQNAGDSEGLSTFLALLNAGVGLTEALPVAKWIQRLEGKGGFKLGHILREAGEEAAQEAFQTTMSDLIATIGNEDLDLMETLKDALYSAGLGAMAGGTLAAGSGLVSRDRRNLAQEQQLLEAGRDRSLAALRVIEEKRAIEELARARSAGLMTKEEYEAETLRVRSTRYALPPPRPPEPPVNQLQSSRMVTQVSPEGIAQQVSQEEHSDFIESGPISRAQTQEGLAHVVGDTGASAATTKKSRRQAQGEETARRRGMFHETHQPQAGVRANTLVAEAQRTHLLAEGAPVGAQPASRGMVRQIAEALGEALAPANAHEQRLLERYQAEKRRTGESDDQIQRRMQEIFGPEDAALARRLANDNFLRNYLQGALIYIEQGQQAGQTDGVGQLYADLGHQLGLTVDDGAAAFPANYNRMEVERNTSTALGRRFERGSRVSVSGQALPATTPLTPRQALRLQEMRVDEGVIEGFEFLPDGSPLIQVRGDNGQTTLAPLNAVKPIGRPTATAPLRAQDRNRARAESLLRVGTTFGQTLGEFQTSPAMAEHPLMQIDWAKPWSEQEGKLTQWEQSVVDEFNDLQRQLDLIPASNTIELESMQQQIEALRQQVESIEYAVQRRELRESTMTDEDALRIGMALGLKVPMNTVDAMDQIVRFRRHTAKYLNQDIAKVLDELSSDRLHDLGLADDYPGIFGNQEQQRKAAAQITADLQTKINQYKLRMAQSLWIDEIAWRASQAPAMQISNQTWESLKATNPEAYNLIRSVHDSTVAKVRGESIPDHVVDGLELRPGKFQTLKEGDEIIVWMDGWTMAVGGVTAQVTTMGNYTLPDGRSLEYGATLYSNSIQAMGLRVVAAGHGAQYAKATREWAAEQYKEIFGNDPETLNQPIEERMATVPTEHVGDGELETMEDSSLNDYTRRATFKGQDPVFVRPIYKEGVKGKIGYAETGWNDRDTRELDEDRDAIAKKYNANKRRVEKWKLPDAQREKGLEFFTPMATVVLYDMDGLEIGHFKFRNQKVAKLYLKEKLEADGVKTYRIRKATPWLEIQGQEARRLEEGGVAGDPTTEPETRGAVPQARPFEADPSAEAGIPLSNFYRPANPVLSGITTMTPFGFTHYRKVTPRSDPQAFKNKQPLPRGKVAMMNIVTRDVIYADPADWILDETKMDPRLEALERAEPRLFRRNLSGEQALAQGQRVTQRTTRELSLTDRAQIIATQTPLNEVSVSQLFTAGVSEINALAKIHAFGNPVLLGLRIGRHIKTESMLNYIKSSRDAWIKRRPMFANSNAAMMWDAMISAATGINMQIPEFDLMTHDWTYVPPFGHLFDPNTRIEGFQRTGQPGRAELVEAAEGAAFNRMGVLEGEGGRPFFTEAVELGANYEVHRVEGDVIVARNLQTGKIERIRKGGLVPTATPGAVLDPRRVGSRVGGLMSGFSRSLDAQGREAVRTVSEVTGPPQFIQTQARMREIAVQSAMPMPVQTSAYARYSLEDWLALSVQEGFGTPVGLGWRIGRNIKDIISLNRILTQRQTIRERMNKLSEGQPDLLADAAIAYADFIGDMRVADSAEIMGALSRAELTPATDFEGKPTINHPVARLVMIDSMFYSTIIQAATGTSDFQLKGRWTEGVTLYNDPSYVPPFRCGSKCKTKMDPQPDDPTKPPASAAVPFEGYHAGGLEPKGPTVQEGEPSVKEPGATEGFRVKQRRKRTTSLHNFVNNEEFRAAYPDAAWRLKHGTYFPRSQEELLAASRALVRDQAYDEETGNSSLDGLVEVARRALSHDPADQFWGISDSFKPAVLYEVVKQLREKRELIKHNNVQVLVRDIESDIWSKLQELGSVSGQTLQVYRLLSSHLSSEFFVNRVIRKMFDKTGQIDTFNEIRPKLNEIKAQIDEMPEGTPKLRKLQDMNALVNLHLKHSGWDRFWALWYGNVLSSGRTQFDNATMSVNALMEGAVSMAAFPNTAHHSLKWVMRGFHLGLQRFPELMRGDWSGRLARPHELITELSEKTFNFRDPLKPWAESEVWWKKAMASVRKVSNLMMGIDTVVSMGGFELRSQTMAFQRAHDNLSKKAKDRGEPVHLTNEMIEQEVQRITKTGPEDLERYRRQVQQEIDNPDVPISEADTEARYQELIRLGLPDDIYHASIQYGLATAGNREPTGFIGAVHRLISNARQTPTYGHGARAVFPFTRWAANWTNIILDYTPPVGLARMFIHSPNWQWIENYSLGAIKLNEKQSEWLEGVRQKMILPSDAQLSHEDFQMLRMRVLFGSIGAMATYALFHSFVDDDEPPLQITGGLYNLQPQERAQLRERGIYPWTVHLFGRSINYRNIPIAALLGFVGNVLDVERYGGGEEAMVARMFTAGWRGSLMVKDMSVMAGWSELLDVISNNRYSTEVRQRTMASWISRVSSGIVPYVGAVRDAEAVLSRAFDVPQYWQATNTMEMLFRDFPAVARTYDKPALNAIGEPVLMDRLPWGRQFYPRRNDAVWDAIGTKMQQGVFIPTVQAATKTMPDGTKQKMSRDEEYRYKTEVSKRFGDEMRANYVWYKYATPEDAQNWLERIGRTIREQARYELNLR